MFLVNYCAVEAGQTPACQDIKSMGFPKLKNSKKRHYLPCLGKFCAAEKPGLIFCFGYEKRNRSCHSHQTGGLKSQ